MTKGNINYYKNLAMIATTVSFCSLFYFNFFVEGFIITISVIILPILLYIYKDVPPIIACIGVSLASPFFRMATLLIKKNTLHNAFNIIWPEIFFYITYGLVYYFFYARRSDRLNSFVLTVFFSDLIANLVEISLRLLTLAISLDIFKGLVVIASIRAMLIFFIVIGIRYFRRLLVSEEHERHYRHLMMLTSNFWGEIYFMEKNVGFIESVMAKSYRLYNNLKKGDYSDDSTALSLDIAKEVHEVKKDYIHVIQGLESITEKRFSDLQMGIDEIVNLVVDTSKNVIKNQALQIAIYSSVKSKATVRYHFYMASIIRNLVNNAMESIGSKKKGYIQIDIKEKKDRVIMTIEDNGVGIKSRDLPFVFNTGFSTKYSSTSGDLQRGLGLSIVRSLVEDVFCGTINVTTKEGDGATFKLAFLKAALRGS